jgi:hypothetical protein
VVLSVRGNGHSQAKMLLLAMSLLLWWWLLRPQLFSATRIRIALKCYWLIIYQIKFMIARSKIELWCILSCDLVYSIIYLSINPPGNLWINSAHGPSQKNHRYPCVFIRGLKRRNRIGSVITLLAPLRLRSFWLPIFPLRLFNAWDVPRDVFQMPFYCMSGVGLTIHVGPTVVMMTRVGSWKIDWMLINGVDPKGFMKWRGRWTEWNTI